jgi:hypothetical protein
MLSETAERETVADDTVSTAVRLMVPFSVAPTDIVPAPTAESAKTALDAPDGIFRVAGTVATAGLLLESETLAPPAEAGDVRNTVPIAVAPRPTLVASSATLETPGAPPAGAVVEFEH